jgi:HEAT repeat protein
MSMHGKLIGWGLVSTLALVTVPQAAGPSPEDSRQYVKELIKRLDHKDPAVRKEAAKCLQACASELRDGATAKLYIKINDTDPDVRREVVRALGSIGPSAAIVALPRLIKALETKDDDWRVELIQALGSMGPHARRALPQLTLLLDDPNPAIRRSVAVALRGLTLHNAIEILPMLIQAYDDPDKGTPDGGSVSLYMQLSVKQLGPNAVAVTEAIRKIHKEEDANVVKLPREIVGQGKGKDRKLVPLLVEVLKSKGDKSLRRSAAYALGIMGPEAVVAFPDLLDALDVTDVKDAKLAARIQVAVLWALGRVGTGLEPMVQAVGGLADNADSAVRAEAAATLKKLCGEAK